MTDMIERAEQMLARQAQEIAQLRSENNYLRRKAEPAHGYHYNTKGRILRRAYDDATSFLVLGFNGYSLSRQFCRELGYAWRRYYWAVGLLRSARIMASKGRALTVDDFATAEAMLERRYKSLKQSPDALELLRVYLPRAMQYAYHGKRQK